MSWMRIGGLNLGVFEPLLGLALVVCVAHGVLRRSSLFPAIPWRAPLLGLFFWQMLGLGWAHRPAAGLQELVAVGVILVSATIIGVFVRTWEDFRRMALTWVGASVLVALISVTTDFNQVASAGKVWEIAARGGRETGLGQQPNWFAMNLMFSVLLAFALALTEKRWAVRIFLAGCGAAIFFAQLRSGSRGGAYAIVIGGGLVACSRPAIRRWMLRFAVVGVILFGVGVFLGEDSTRKGLMRIWLNLGNLWRSDVRGRSWWVCIEMFRNTWGIGIGPGSFAVLLEQYDWKLFSSIHRYPHGIFWGVMAHYGIVGLSLALWGAVAVFRMGRGILERTRGTEAEVFAWVMPATIVGYVAWSFVEFNFDDKPFWEYLALYTVLARVPLPQQEEVA
jgi:O-antigen ligase